MSVLLSTVPPLACPISTLLVDDCSAFCQGLRSLLDFYSTTSPLRFQVVGQANSCEQAIDHAIQQSPMLILLDLDLGQSSGLEVLERLRSHPKASRVLVLSAHQEGEWIFKAMQAGAKGYLFKQNLSSHLLEAIQVVMQNQVYLSPEVATRFFQLFHFAAGRSMPGTQTIHLTERERDVLHWLVQGVSNEVIAHKLNITVGTVKAYLTTIFEKMNVSSRTQAALQALKLGLISA
jgi:DNA-binding NarL/FixJ family response regulator